nr:hypothetical protein [uncultured Butyrivibrio sp.]
MNKNTEFVKYLEELLTRYDRKISWLCEKAGINDSTFRKWRKGGRPSKGSIEQIRLVIKKYMPDEINIYEKAVIALDEGISPKKPTEFDEQIKILGKIIDARDFTEEEKIELKKGAVELLIKHGYDFAEKYAKTVIFKEAIPEVAHVYEETKDIPKAITLKTTDIETKTFSIIEGFFLDMVRLPNGEGDGTDIYDFFLWHKYTRDCKLLVFSVTKNEVIEKYGDFMNGITIMADEILKYQILVYTEIFMNQDDRTCDCQSCSVHNQETDTTEDEA